MVPRFLWAYLLAGRRCSWPVKLGSDHLWIARFFYCILNAKTLEDPSKAGQLLISQLFIRGAGLGSGRREESVGVFPVFFCCHWPLEKCSGRPGFMCRVAGFAGVFPPGFAGVLPDMIPPARVRGGLPGSIVGYPGLLVSFPSFLLSKPRMTPANPTNCELQGCCCFS